MGTGAESTPEKTVVDRRWDGREQDLEDYNLIFDEALDMIARDEREEGSLLMMIINEFEKNRRSVAMPIISAALSVAMANRERRELLQGCEDLLKEPERS